MQEPTRVKLHTRYAPRNSVKRVSLADFIHCHAAVLRKVPGQGVEMIGNTEGAERVYIYTLPSSNSSGSNIQLIFSIMAFDKQTKPTASLTLAENYERVKDLDILLPFLDTTQSTLIEYLKRRSAPLPAFTEINCYIDAIRTVIDTVGNDIVWA